jgi:N-hydroxyarylamine O-acetyltransferase
VAELGELAQQRILRRLDMSRPSLDLAGLARLYEGWCQRVPFDNSRKLGHVGAGNPGPLPGDSPEDFFDSWLAHGTGGTCWAGNGALHALLRSLGFEAHRGIATMLAIPDLPPNHGTVAVDVPEGRFLVDASMLHREPLPLRDEVTRIDHYAWGVEAKPVEDGRTTVRWSPFHSDDGMDCRLERFGASEADFRELHEITRRESAFNHALCVRLVRDDRSFGFWFGKYGERRASGERCYETRSGAFRRQLLREAVGMSAEHVDAIPPDRKPPGPAGQS